MKRQARAAAVVALIALPSAAGAATDGVEGFWLSENERAIIEIGSCGPEVCGRMVWLRDPRDETGAPKRDAHGNPLCGIPLVAGFRPEGENRWDDGRIYNPRDGATYSARMTLLDRERLEVRGYLGLPIFGQSQVWTRAEDDRGGC